MVKFIKAARLTTVTMEKTADQDKTLFELYPELEVKLRALREQARRLGLQGKFEFS